MTIFSPTESGSCGVDFSDTSLRLEDHLPRPGKVFLCVLSLGELAEALGPEAEGWDGVNPFPLLGPGLPLDLLLSCYRFYQGIDLPAFAGGGPATLEKAIPLIGAILAAVEQEPGEGEHRHQVVLHALAWLVRVAGCATDDLIRRLIKDVRSRLPTPHLRDSARQCLRRTFKGFQIAAHLGDQDQRLRTEWRPALARLDADILRELSKRLAAIPGRLRWDLVDAEVRLLESETVKEEEAPEVDDKSGPQTVDTTVQNDTSAPVPVRPPRAERLEIVEFFRFIGQRVFLLLVPEGTTTLASGQVVVTREILEQLTAAVTLSRSDVGRWIKGLPARVRAWMRMVLAEGTELRSCPVIV